MGKGKAIVFFSILMTVLISGTFTYLSTIKPNPKIAIVTLWTHHIAEYARLSEKINRAYAKRHNYDFIVAHRRLNNKPDDFAVQWDKVHLVAKHLNKYDYVVWLDADAIVAKPDVTIESLIQRGKNKDFISSKDMIYRHANDFNTGVFIVKNTSWSHHLLKTMQSIPQCQDYGKQDYYEQSCFEIVFQQNIYDAKSHMYRFEAEQLNINMPETGFAYHLMGEKNDRRAEIFKTWLDKA